MIRRERFLVRRKKQVGGSSWKLQKVHLRILYRTTCSHERHCSSARIAVAFVPTSFPCMPSITANDVFTFLSILAVLMTVIALYHVLFILVDVRKIVRRFDDVTLQVEALILKPISMADQIIVWLMEQLQNRTHEKKHHVEHEKKD